MGDPDYDKEHLERKKKLRDLHRKLKETREIQEIYHKIMGSVQEGDTEESQEQEEI